MDLSKLSKEVQELYKEYDKLNDEHISLSYRMGTNGERGLYPQLKSLRAKMHKVNKKLKPFGFIVRSISNFETRIIKL